MLCRAPTLRGGRERPTLRGGGGRPTLPGRPGSVHVTGEKRRAPHVTGGAGRRERPTLRESEAQRRALRAAPLEPSAAPSCGVLSAALAPKATTSTSGGPPSSGPQAPCTRAACSSRYHLHRYPFKPPEGKVLPIGSWFRYSCER